MASAGSEASHCILVVDDDPSITRMLRRLLGPDHDVVECNESRAALRLIAGGVRFDLVLCDWVMPGLSGGAFCEAVRAICPSLAERIVFLTGAAAEATSGGPPPETPNERLAKPFNVQELRRTVADRLRVSGAWKAHRRGPAAPRGLRRGLPSSKRELGDVGDARRRASGRSVFRQNDLRGPLSPTILFLRG